jgi:hypothetical protein
MRCDDVRDLLNDTWDGEEPSEIRQHLAGCDSCAAFRSDLGLVRGGLALWKMDEAPSPSPGFADRLVRQLGNLGKAPSVAEFFERVGRRFVYGTLALTFLALLAFVVPSTGPVRALNAADIQMPEQEASLAYSDPMGAAGPQELPDAVPVEVSTPAVMDEAK